LGSSTNEVRGDICGFHVLALIDDVSAATEPARLAHIPAKTNSALAVSSAKKCAAKKQQVIFMPHIFLHRMPFLLESPVKAVVGVDS